MKSEKNADKLLSKVRELCLAFPEAKEVEAWGHPTFRAGKKLFAAFGEACRAHARSRLAA